MGNFVNSNLSAKVKERLQNSDFWTSRTKESGKYISELICPECGKPEAYAHKENPMAIFCSRMKECGVKTLTLSLFPEIRQNVEKEYPPSEEEPHKPALHYLLSRGLEKSLKGLSFEYWKKTRQGCGGAVMFPVSTEVWNGRLFNPNGTGKSHTVGSYGGLFWKHPGIEYKAEKSVYVTEGIIDALSFIEAGFQAIALISSGQNPEKLNLSEFQRIYLAFDNDNAGIRALKKWKSAHPDYQAILPDSGNDWNDLLINSGREKFSEKFLYFSNNAALALAKTAIQYVEIFYGFHGFIPGLFAFDGCYWMSTLKPKPTKENPDAVELNAYKCSDFTMEPLYKRLFIDTNKQAEYSYFLRVTPKNEKPVDMTIDGKELAMLSTTRQAFGFRAGATWFGDNNALTKLQEKIRRAKIQQLQVLDSAGFHNGCYIHSHFMIDEKGGFHRPDKIGNFSKFEPFQLEDALKPVDNSRLSAKKVQEALYKAWGKPGLVAMAWAAASWFRSQILEEAGFFPFLSLYGEPQTGKSNLIKILQHCQGFKNEGHGLKKADTIKFISRSIAQRSNLFFAVLEEQGKKYSKFDYSGIVLTGYNGSALQGRASFSNDNKTQSSPLLCGMAFIQNLEPFTTQQEKERVISVPFKVEQLSEQSFQAFREILKYKPSEFIQVFVDVMKYKQDIEKRWYEQFNKIRDEFFINLKDNRIAEVSAILLSFHNLLCKITGNDFDIKDYILQLANDKISCKSNDLPEADLVLDYVFLHGEEIRKYVKIDNENKTLSFHWGSVKQEVESFRNINQGEIIKQFRQHESFIAYKNVRFSKDSTMKSYIFDLTKMSFAALDESAKCHDCSWIDTEKGVFICHKHKRKPIHTASRGCMDFDG